MTKQESEEIYHKRDACTAFALPRLKADLLLLHPPAFFDFRRRRDIYFPFLGTSGDIPVTPLYEYFPLGFKSLQRFLGEHGHDVKIVNLCTVMLCYPWIDMTSLVGALDARLIGIDLHWMVHVQGSLAVAQLIKRLRPDIPIIFGGLSATYYAEQIIQYPFVDMVMRGYDTHGPMETLLRTLKQSRSLDGVPNLLWKAPGEEIHDNGFLHIPETFGRGIDWSRQRFQPKPQTLPILEFMSTQNAGCSCNCVWCGGSREAFGRMFGRNMARKPLSELRYEFESIKRLPGANRYYFYSVGFYNEPKKGIDFFLDRVGESNLGSISYEQFYLTSDDILRRMAAANKRTIITLSPQSHDLRVSKLSGRGTYTNEELERWLHKALAYGIHQVDIWYFIGMPEQDEKSVMETVDYCERLLDIFRGQRINPVICTMLPFLDPGSSAFEFPEQYGYRVIKRTVEEHRSGMERASIINRLNYETQWMSRSDLIHVGFRAVRGLMEAKATTGFLPSSWVKNYNGKIDDALEFIDVIHEVDCLPDEKERRRELDRLGHEILRRNELVFFSGVINQAFPVNRQVGGRWFDETGWDPESLEKTGPSDSQ
jgi:clorobiocin/coumermycin A biosynthesis protein CloN6/CouN6